MIFHIIYKITSYRANQSRCVKLDKITHWETDHLNQGSLKALSLAFVLFTVYVSPVASLLSHLGVKQHQYSDNTQHSS